MKNCPKCRKEVNKEYEFCPFCGTSLDENNDWGMLGKNDFSDNVFQGMGMGFTGNIFNKMIGNAMKMIEKEMQRSMKEGEMPMPRTKVQLYVNGKKIPMQGEMQQQQKAPVKKEKTPSLSRAFSTQNQKKFANLPKEEPMTNVRRLSDRVIYEIDMPDVKSIEDISIKNLENSIEIKAIGKSRAYYKIISVGFPVIDFYIEKGKLILELEAKN